VADTSGKLSNYLAQRERRGRITKVLLLVLLVLLLLALLWVTFSYLSNGRVVIPLVTNRTREVLPPEYLYSIAGPTGPNALRQPIGVAVSPDNRVYVVDNTSAKVRCYDTDGRYRFSFSEIRSAEATSLTEPGRVAVSPTGEVWVTDRRLRGIFVFDRDGGFVREFMPPKNIHDTWAPTWVSFDAAGLVYVCDVGNNELHRVFVFDQEGNEKGRWGKTVQAKRATEGPGEFYYPSGISVAKNTDVFVSDSNNRRVQVFNATGRFKYFIATSGTPRGSTIDPQQRLYVVDAFAHMVDIYDLKGRRITGFGGGGVAPGKFQYPTDVALDRRGRIFVTDRENNQVQVWAWPVAEALPPLEPPKNAGQWAICLSPLLLLPLLLLRRRRSFVVTEDFIISMAELEQMDLMAERRFRWLVPIADIDKYEGKTLNGVSLDDLLEPTQHSESDAADLIEKTGIDHETAVLLVMCKRTGRLATQERELRRAAQAMGVDVVDADGFVERFAKGGGARSDRGSGQVS